MAKIRDAAETFGGCLLYAAFLIIPIILILAFVKSMAWIMDVLFPKVVVASGIALLSVPVLLLFAIPRKTRPWAGLLMTIASYVIGLHLWLWSFIIAFTLAGLFWLIVGLFFAGVGVVAVAAIAAVLNAEWAVAGQIVLGVVIVYALRFFGMFLIEKSEPKDEYDSLPPLPPDFESSEREGF